MRLTNSERELIKKAFLESFQDGKMYLFGSRVDDTKRGGDIDLYICPTIRCDNERELKRKFQILLNEYIGEQKIDVVMAKDKDRPIEQEALRTGVELMSINANGLKIKKYLNECAKHKQRISEAFLNIKDIFPLSGKKYQVLSDDEIKNIDQFLFRFTKMQDTIGDKLLKAVASEFVDGVEKMTFFDILNTLEKADILNSANDWKRLREVRNNIAHQYDDEPDEMAMALNDIFAQKDTLFEVFDKILEFYGRRNPKNIKVLSDI
jgi:predicted nucleotidyltransferase